MRDLSAFAKSVSDNSKLAKGLPGIDELNAYYAGSGAALSLVSGASAAAAAGLVGAGLPGTGKKSVWFDVFKSLMGAGSPTTLLFADSDMAAADLSKLQKKLQATAHGLKLPGGTTMAENHSDHAALMAQVKNIK